MFIPWYILLFVFPLTYLGLCTVFIMFMSVYGCWRRPKTFDYRWIS